MSEEKIIKRRDVRIETVIAFSGEIKRVAINIPIKINAEVDASIPRMSVPKYVRI